ncbi:MAG: transposase [Methylocella sp.]
MTLAERAVIEPLLPPRAAAGLPPRPLREIAGAVFHVPRGGVPWRMPPPCLPPVLNRPRARRHFVGRQ